MNSRLGSGLYFMPLLRLLIGIAVVAGCSASERDAAKHPKTAEQASPSITDSTNDKSAEPEASAKPFKLGDLVEPFTPPSLAELDKTAGWTDGPVRDGTEILREKQSKEGPPPVTVEQALALRNDSDENNAKILGTLSRLPPPGGEGVNYDATWVRQVGGDLKSTNPLLITSVTDFEYQSLTGFGLFGEDQDFNNFASKDAVISWQTSKDHLMDKVVIRSDLIWSDGQPITANDVAFSYQAIMSSAVPITAVRTGTDKLKWVEAYDDYTVVFFHKEALATNVNNMSFPIIPKHVYEKSLPDDPSMTHSAYHTKLEEDPVVGGSYTLTKRERSVQFVVERRDGYYMFKGKQVREKPYLKQIRTKVIEDQNTALLAQKAGDIEEMELRSEEWANKTDGDDFYKLNTKVKASEWTEFHFEWNLKSPFFSDKRVRQAMSYAFDYHEFLHTISHDVYQPCAGMFHPDSWMFPKSGGPKPYEQDLDKAEDLLDQAGWKDSDGDGIRDKEIDGKRVPFKFTLYTYPTDSAMQAATLMKNCLEKIGITCYVKPTEFAVMIAKVEDKDFDAAFGGWGSGSDPDSETNIWGTGEGRNYIGYSNPRVDELLDKGRHEFDRDKRAAIYGEMLNLIWDDQPYTWLFVRNAFYAFNKSVRGYNFAPTGPFNYSPGIGSIYRIATP
jgi:peptide/nickel transport system substrate-binding protein